VSNDATTTQSPIIQPPIIQPPIIQLLATAEPPIGEAAYSANFKLVLTNYNLPVNLTLRAGADTTPTEFLAKLNDMLQAMLGANWSIKEATLTANQDIQEASAYIVGRSSAGVRIVHLFHPPLEKRTGYVYEELLHLLPFRLRGDEPEYPVAGVNPQLPRDEQYLNRLPGTFQFIRTAQPAKDGGMAAKRYTRVYFVPAAMQLELENQEAFNVAATTSDTEVSTAASPAAAPAATQSHTDNTHALKNLRMLFGNVFGQADVDETLAYFTRKYLMALRETNKGTGGPSIEVHEDVSKLNAAQLTHMYNVVGNQPGKYQEDWNRVRNPIAHAH